MRGPFASLGILALGAALFKNEKVDGEEPKGFWDKTTTFIKNHCGKIAFIGMLPALAEEAMASVKGLKLAKGILSPEHLNKLKVFSAKAWLTYLGVAVGSGLAVHIASSIRDKIAAPKEIKSHSNA